MEHVVAAEVDGHGRVGARGRRRRRPERRGPAGRRAGRDRRRPRGDRPRPRGRTSGPTWPTWSSATPAAWTPPGPTRSSAGGGPASGRPGRTSRTSATRARFVEFAPLAIAAQRRRRELDDLIARTPADGLVGGVGRVDGRSVVVASYDYTVLAGTQGFQNHRKKDRLFELAERQRLPVVLFAEGGGGRPGDTDAPGVSGLDTMAFHLFARLSGHGPAGRDHVRPAASPATPPCSAAATWSSPPRAPTSAWAARP